MTIETELCTVTYTGNGSSSEWAHSFPVNQKADLTVTLITVATEAEVVLDPATYDWIQNDDLSGTVEYPTSGSPISSSYQLRIDRNVDFIQELEISNQSGFNPRVIEGQLDKIVMQTQELKRDLTSVTTTADGFEALIDGLLSGVVDVMVLDSFSGLASLTDAYTGEVVYVKSYTADKRKGGAFFILDEADVVTATDSATVAVDSDGRRWKRVDTGTGAIPLAAFGAIGDGVTDDTTAIQRAFDFAANLITDVGYMQSRQVVLDGGGQRYLVSNRLTLDGSSVALRDTIFEADDASANWTTSNSVLLVDGEDMFLENIHVDCNGCANGIEHAAASAVYVNVLIHYCGWHADSYGFFTDGGGPVNAIRLDVTGVPFSVGSDQADRLGTCIKLVNNGDSKFVQCVASFANVVLWNEDVTNNKFTECHFYNVNGSDLVTPHVDTICVKNVSATVFLNACYIDNGYVDLYDQDCVIQGCFFLYSALKTTLTARIRLFASQVNDTLDRLQISNNFFTRSTNIPVFEFNTTGLNTWASSVNQTHMEAPERDMMTGYKELVIVSSDSANQNVLKLVSNAIKARLRFADKNSTLDAEPCIESASDTLAFGIVGTMYLKMTSLGKWLMGTTSITAGATANASILETDDGIRIASDGGKTNTRSLDAYLEEAFTPVLTFVTPGDLAVTYSQQVGRYTRIGNTIHYTVRIETSAFTHTTASGVMRITGLPVVAKTGTGQPAGASLLQGYTKANFTQVMGSVVGGTQYLTMDAGGSGQSIASLTAADMPTGGTVKLYVSGHYEVET